MGYPTIAKSLANTALDIVPGGSVAKGVIKSIGGIFGGKGPKYAKSLAETRAAGKAGDIATLQYKLTNTKYPEVAKSAKAYLDLLLAKSTGSRSDGYLQLKGKQPVLVAGGGPMTGIPQTKLPAGSAPAGGWGSGGHTESELEMVYGYGKKKRRKRRKKATRKSRSSRRKRTSASRRKSKKRSTRGRKLKFGSAAYRKKYLGHR